MEPKQRLEELREAIEAENISFGEISELQNLVEHIEPGDTTLLEWAGVPEHEQELGDVTLTVAFEIHATSIREAQKWLDNALRHAEDDEALKQYEVVQTEWQSR